MYDYNNFCCVTLAQNHGDWDNSDENMGLFSENNNAWKMLKEPSKM